MSGILWKNYHPVQCGTKRNDYRKRCCWWTTQERSTVATQAKCGCCIRPRERTHNLWFFFCLNGTITNWIGKVLHEHWLTLLHRSRNVWIEWISRDNKGENIQRQALAQRIRLPLFKSFKWDKPFLNLYFRLLPKWNDWMISIAMLITKPDRMNVKLL